MLRIRKLKARPLLISILGVCLMIFLSFGYEGGSLFAEVSSNELSNQKDVEKARRVVINVKH